MDLEQEQVVDFRGIGMMSLVSRIFPEPLLTYLFAPTNG